MAKNGVLCHWGPWKKGDILLITIMCCFHCWEMKKRMNEKHHPDSDTWKELEESSLFFYWALLSESDLEYVSFFPLETDSNMSLISSMVKKIPWSRNEKSHNICILHGLPTILWNWSHFHVLQHCTTWLWNLLEKNLAKLPTNCFDQLFSSTTSIGIILQLSEHDMLL